MNLSLTEKYRPRRLADFVGFSRIAKILSHLASHPREGAILLLGAPGLGKTTMGLAMCEEMNAELHHIPSKACDIDAVQHVCEICRYVPMFGAWHFVLIDEIDKITNAAQLAMLSKLDATCAPPKTLFLFTGNETVGLEDRFLSRCRILELDHSAIADEAAEFLESVWRKERMPMRSAPNFRDLFLRSRSNFRSALNAMEIEMIAPSEPKPKPKILSETGLFTIGVEKLDPNNLKRIVGTLGISKIVDCGPKELPRRIDFQRAMEGAGVPWTLRPGLRGRTIEKQEIAWLAEASRASTVLLVSRAEAPGQCPRHRNISLPLLKQGVDAIHVYQDHVVTASALQKSIEADSDYDVQYIEELTA